MASQNKSPREPFGLARLLQFYVNPLDRWSGRKKKDPPIWQRVNAAPRHTPGNLMI